MREPSPVVAEIQGLYGPFSFPEKLLQKIWLRGDFDRRRAITTDGHSVAVISPGKWNLLGGPDFLGARIRIGDSAEITGDVELHLRASDWGAHGHAGDPAYHHVVLHVVLFPPDVGCVTRGAGGRVIPVVALLPLLHHDLEEFAADDAVETLAGRTHAKVSEKLAGLSNPALMVVLRESAQARWRQKVRFARLRIERLGWGNACHHTALEILGYRFNRAPMLNVASRWPLADWSGSQPGPAVMFDEFLDGWSLHGVRPANHPRTRLRQYEAWTRAQPNWPELFVRFREPRRDCGPAAEDLASTPEIRRRLQFAGLRKRFAAEICGAALGGSRLDNLICDGFFPLLAARAGQSDLAGSWYGVWYHWFAGDMPPVVMRSLRELGVFSGQMQPSCHGAAQGLLGWLLAQEARS